MAAAFQVETQMDVLAEVRFQLREARRHSHAAQELREADDAEQTGEHDHRDHDRF